MSYYFKWPPQPKKVHDPKKAPIEVIGGTTNTCENTVTPLTPLTTGAIAKIPVVLAQFNVQFNVNAIVNLPENALEIKKIKKDLKITQCLLLQNTNVLFIKGVIRKNIEYATLGKFATSQGFCGDIRHCTVDVPFDCTTPVIFNGNNPLPVINSTSEEFVYSNKQDLKAPDFAHKDKLLSSDTSEFNQVTTQFYNELPYCELVNSNIIEFDEFLNQSIPAKRNLPFEQKAFDRIEQKMVIFLTLTLLQNRQVAIGPTLLPSKPKPFDKIDAE